MPRPGSACRDRLQDRPGVPSAPLTRHDTLVLKAIAILGIAFHNYYHVLGPVRENEFEFAPARFTVFLDSLHDPWLILPALFSFFGHYGVQIFIFLSAYGLSLSHWDTPEHWPQFMWSRVKKIYPMFLLAIGTCLLYMGLGGVNPLSILRQHFATLTWTALAVQNLGPDNVWPPFGPWWFLAFIIQFYCVWPWLKALVKRYGIRGLVLLSIFSVALFYIAGYLLTSRWSISLAKTPVLHLPELCLGVLAGRYGILPRTPASGLIGLVLLIGGNTDSALWPLSFLGSLLLVLWIYQMAAQRLSRWSFLEKLGACSMALFFVNGFVRMPFVAMAQHQTLAGRLWVGFASTAAAILVASLLDSAEKKTRTRFANKGHYQKP
jgi:peptidoglycan/LPS O-acetylase OafA/YrhL